MTQANQGTGTVLKISDTCVVPPGGFEVIYLDWPWHYRDRLDHDNMRGAAEDHYKVLKPKDLNNLYLDPIAADNCVVFFWVTSPQLDVALRAFDVWALRQKEDGLPRSKRWSYVTKAFAWTKMNKKATDTPFFGLGRWTRSSTEDVLLLKIGKPQRVGKGVPQLIQTPIGKHSAKPPEARDRIVELMGDVPRVELFAREKTPGWQATGLELDGVDIRDTVLWRPNHE